MLRFRLRRLNSAWLLTLLWVITTAPNCNAATRQEINAGVSRALTQLYRTVPGSRGLARKAAGILVFPTIFKAGFGIGGEYGEGALRIAGRTMGYYNTISASIGFQFGAQARSVVIMFMTREALAGFRRRDGWKAGVDGSVALVTVGLGGSVDTNQITSPIIGFMFGSKGLMYNLTLEGSKITRISR